MRKGVVLGLLVVLLLGSYASVWAAALTPAERAGLLYMREEEKLARDVYLALAEKWRLPVFSNIASAEQIHMDRFRDLLAKYGLADPAANKGRGEFTNPEFTALYAELTSAGSASLAEALSAGVTIEERDIADLANLIAVARQRDLRNVCTNLRSASYNHLAAFQRALAAQ